MRQRRAYKRLRNAVLLAASGDPMPHAISALIWRHVTESSALSEAWTYAHALRQFNRIPEECRDDARVQSVRRAITDAMNAALDDHDKVFLPFEQAPRVIAKAKRTKKQRAPRVEEKPIPKPSEPLPRSNPIAPFGWLGNARGTR